MSIRAVVFDIGGVLEITPNIGWDKKWEQSLGLQAGELNQRLAEIWEGGSLGTLSIGEVQTGIRQALGLSENQVNEFMADLWREYLGTLNTDLFDYFRNLRPRYKTAIISNSFVGAREQEEQHYHLSEICDFIIYSHEVGLSKPDARIFTLACERLGLPPHEVIFVDDHEEVMTSARELGMRCIEYKNNPQVIAAIEALLEIKTKGVDHDCTRLSSQNFPPQGRRV